MSPKKLVAIVGERTLAHQMAAALENLIDPPPEALTLFEDGANWRIEAYVADPADAGSTTRALEELLGRPLPPLAAEDVPDLNWVALSQAALPPVFAGRFVVHGSHDRARVPRGPNAIMIDAGEAFGTAHHATTYGCLLAIDDLARRRAFRRVLDLGCGSGVLSIAAAKAMPGAGVLATDIDARSIEVARENTRANSVARRIRLICAEGFAHPLLRRRAAFDLVIANILAGPLIELANDLAPLIAARGKLVLSGLLIDQAPAVIAAYRGAGLRLETHRRVNGWSTLSLSRRGACARVDAALPRAA